PMETRALAIAFFYAIGTGAGGIVGPLLFGHLIATHERSMILVAFLIGAAVMAVGGIAELFLGVNAEQTQLEDVAKPLTAEEAESGELAGDESADAEQQPSDDEERWRERSDRRSRLEREGRRRYRLGPGGGESFYSPGMLGTSVRSRQPSPALLDR